MIQRQILLKAVGLLLTLLGSLLRNVERLEVHEDAECKNRGQTTDFMRCSIFQVAYIFVHMRMETLPPENDHTLEKFVKGNQDQFSFYQIIPLHFKEFLKQLLLHLKLFELYFLKILVKFNALNKI